MNNLGVQKKDIVPQDWVLGEYSPLGAYTGLPIDHEKYLPVIEYQNNFGWDRWACVSYAILNWFEIRHIELTGREINCSDRFLAKASNTRIGFGNFVDVVFDTLKNKGFVKESDYQDVATVDEYYSPIPLELFSKAKENIEPFTLYREWINPNNYNAIRDALYETPLPVTVQYASGKGVLYPKGNQGHEVLLYGLDDSGHFKIFDHYTQSKKVYHKDYIFGSILKPTLKLKNTIMAFIPKDNYLYLLVEGGEQKLAMGLNGNLIVYDKKIDTLLNSASRSKKYKVPTPITMEMWQQCDKLNGKGDLIEKKLI